MPVRPTRVRRLRARRAIGNAVLAGVVLAAGAAYLAVEKTVTLVVDDGRPEAVRTMSASVGELLGGEGIVLGYGDLVIPPVATSLADGMTILVDRRSVGKGGPEPEGVGVWVMEGATAPELMLAAGIAEDGSSGGGPVGRPPMVSAHVVVMGKGHDVLTNASTVRELLSAMGIEPDGDDRVLPSPSTPLTYGAKVRFVQIQMRASEVRLPIPYATITRYSDSLRPGEVHLIRAGVAGVLLERTRTRYVNGVTAGRVVLARQVIEAPIAARRVVGSDNSTHGTEGGEASWYSFAPGDGLTAAHPWLPFGTVVTVTNLGNGRTVQVVINDRGPFGGRIIDLSSQAFSRIAPLGQGVCQVRLSW